MNEERRERIIAFIQRYDTLRDYDEWGWLVKEYKKELRKDTEVESVYRAKHKI
jgi:hypothetical protein